MDRRRYLLAFMIGLAVSLSLSAAFSRSGYLQALAAPLTRPAARQAAEAESPDAVYTIPWYTINNGGGSGTGGHYELKYTIGQPDASVLAGSPYTLQDGFWPGVFQFWNLGLPFVVR